MLLAVCHRRVARIGDRFSARRRPEARNAARTAPAKRTRTRAGPGTIGLDVDYDGYDLHGFVTDGGDGFDYQPSSADTDEPRGRGLPIVDALVTRWGIRDGRTHVWFDIASVRGATQ